VAVDRADDDHRECSGLDIPLEAVYRVLAPGWKLGMLIGKGGTSINQVRESTGATIRVHAEVRTRLERGNGKPM
jgi:hypothetical protein